MPLPSAHFGHPAAIHENFPFMSCHYLNGFARAAGYECRASLESTKVSFFFNTFDIFAPPKAQMAELVDALVSNTSGFTSMPVRSRLWVLIKF
jgi:hypothetical protein